MVFKLKRRREALFKMGREIPNSGNDRCFNMGCPPVDACRINPCKSTNGVAISESESQRHIPSSPAQTSVPCRLPAADPQSTASTKTATLHHSEHDFASKHASQLSATPWTTTPLLPDDLLLPFPALAQTPSSHNLKIDDHDKPGRPFEPTSPPAPLACPSAPAAFLWPPGTAAASAADPFHGDWPHW
jgi:hypothetical protein